MKKYLMIVLVLVGFMSCALDEHRGLWSNETVTISLSYEYIIINGKQYSIIEDSNRLKLSIVGIYSNYLCIELDGNIMYLY